MMINSKDYTYRITWSEADGEYVALCDAFPSLSFLAPERAAAREGLAKLADEVVNDMNGNSGDIC